MSAGERIFPWIVPFISFSGYGSTDDLKRELGTARSMLQPRDSEPLNIGVGFLVWQLEKNRTQAENFLSITLEAEVRAIWLAFGEDIGQWIAFIRTHDRNSGTIGSVKIFVQVSTVEDALQATNEWKADVIVAQGS